MRKSVAFGAVHLATSFGVGYALSGSVSVAGAITLVEPLVNTVAHYFFDRWWDAREQTHEAATDAAVDKPLDLRVAA